MSRAVFTPSRRHVPSALNLLLVLGALLLAAALGAPPAAAQANTANRTVFSDDFSSPGRWLLPAEADGAVSFGKGRLTLHSRPDSSNAVVVAHKLLLSPAASYRVSAEITVTERHNEDALAGAHRKFKRPPKPDDQTAASQDGTSAAVRSWLRRPFGPSRRFPWGSSGLDLRSRS